MPYVEVHVDASEVLSDLDDSELREELARREAKAKPVGSRELTEQMLLERAWWHFRDNGGAPDCLREYFWRVLGKTL